MTIRRHNLASRSLHHRLIRKWSVYDTRISLLYVPLPTLFNALQSLILPGYRRSIFPLLMQKLIADSLIIIALSSLFLQVLFPLPLLLPQLVPSPPALAA